MTADTPPTPSREYALGVGRRIRAAREAAGLTRADVPGFAESRIKSYELGHRAITVTSLHEIALALGVEITSLLPPTGGATVLVPAEQAAVLRHVADLLEVSWA